VSLTGDYQSTVQRVLASAEDAEEQLPLALVQACVAVLPIDGAGLSLTQELRVPLSASSDMVARAERLQVTLGEGPCLSATEVGHPLIADLDALSTEWPVYCSELVSQTSFRSVASLPIRLPDGYRLGAVDLYSDDPQGGAFTAIPEVGLEFADLIAAFLLGTLRWLADDEAAGSDDLEAAARRRLNVWVAVGMVMGRMTMTNLDALALLRAFAFSHGLTLDDLAEQVTHRELPLSALLD
jgi:hypothetical protein